MSIKFKATIQETREEYKDDSSVNPSLLWEMIKLKVREKSIAYSKAKNKQMQNREKKLEQTIAKLEEEFDKSNLSDKQLTDLEKQLAEQKSELETIIEFRTKGAILRSKTKWYNEGEENTKYFLILEKRYLNKGPLTNLK